mgnify:CR=1 FL=1
MVLKLYLYLNVYLINMKYLIFIPLSLNLLLTQIYDFSDFPTEEESFTTADFRLYIPENIDTIRGIYAYMHGFGGDSRTIVQDSIMIELVKSIDFVLMGVRLDNMHMDSGIGNSLIEAKASFANQSNQPELIYSPLFFDGYSWGGQWSYHYTRWRPQDVIAFITMKGGYHDTTYSESAINVPGYMFVGENDLDYRIENLTNIFLEHRQVGALWALAMEPNAGHNRISDRFLLNNFLFDIINRRLPQTFNIDEPVSLLSLEESESWLGNRDNFYIYSYDCYDDNIEEASWLSNMINAQNWQYFVSDSIVDNLIDCHLGDLNLDGILSVLDVMIILDIILGYELYDSNADMNYDEIINIEDIMILIYEILNN